MTRITCVDVDSGDTETVEIAADQYVVICGGDRYVASEQFHPTTGTTNLTVKTHRDGGDWR